MRLRADRHQEVTIADLGLTVAFAAGEELLTEISAKFTPAGSPTSCTRPTSSSTGVGCRRRGVPPHPGPPLLLRRPAAAGGSGAPE